ncbi:hypothetical protein [Haloarcula laminariae]|uniref:hypothetical protein n=1 Tax=Haloarcula laminariae TaxID=2961577 RepID=UPI0021C7C85D|nr:hypothetical protein [Halomicroarcula laminariae]
MSGTSESPTGTQSQTRTVVETPVYDCEDANRPPKPPTSEEPVDGRYTYPQRPESLSDESVVLPYIEAYERAFRLNDLYSQYSANLIHASIIIYDTWTYEAPKGAAIARLKYTYGYGYAQGDRQVEADSPTIYASYYIDEAVVHRRVIRGHQEDESKLVPDPTEGGLPVECF